MVPDLKSLTEERKLEIKVANEIKDFLKRKNESFRNASHCFSMKKINETLREK